MANDTRRKSETPEREQPKDLRETTRPLPQGGLRLSDGPEMLRSNHC